VHSELADHRLARPGRRGEQDSVAVAQRTAGTDLEIVELEVIELPEGRQLWVILGNAPTRGGVAVRGAHRGAHAIKTRRARDRSGRPATVAAGRRPWRRACGDL